MTVQRVDGATTYRDIFDRRADRYHRACTRWPAARWSELDLIASRLRAGSGDRVLDAPCGGGYLAARLPAGVEVVGVDPSEAFAGLGRAHASHPVHCAPLDALPFEDASFDAVASLAGLHHLDDLDAVLRSFARVLTPQGRMVLADVERGSGPAAFLDGFVDAHNTLGHRGTYLGPETAARLRAVGLEVSEDRVVELAWTLPSDDALAHFLADLFGIDADPGTILDAVAHEPGVQRRHGAVLLRWSLRVLVAHGPQPARSAATS